MISPQGLGVPHPTWREHQFETYEQLNSLPNGSIAIVEAQCGSGKSAWPAALGHDRKVITVTETRSLQSQYSDIYNFAKVIGRGNFPCINPDRLFDSASCDDCLYGTSMHRCPVASRCLYLIQKEIAKAAPRAVLNYAFWGLTGNRKYNDGSFIWSKDILTLDEAHNLDEVCVRYYSIEAQPKHKNWYGFPDFPIISSGMPVSIQRDRAEPWLESCAIILAERIRLTGRQIKLEHSTKGKQRLASELRRAQRLQLRFRSALLALRSVPEDWFISSGSDGLLVKPLTAKHVFRHGYLQDLQAVTIAMSATIGNPIPFTEELGIEDYESISVPSRFAPERRPIYVAKNCPRMSNKATGADFERQADLIAEAIHNCPSEWSGVVHTTRKSESWLLRERLARRGLGSRVWVPPGHEKGNYVPTDEQFIAWEQRRARIPNSIVISWSMMQGVDLLDEKICISAKCPYRVWGSDGSYEQAWRQYSLERYNYKASVLLVQSLGRTRRGREEDYDTATEQRGLVAIFDGSFDHRIKKGMSKEILDSLVEI